MGPARRSWGRARAPPLAARRYVAPASPGRPFPTLRLPVLTAPGHGACRCAAVRYGRARGASTSTVNLLSYALNNFERRALNCNAKCLRRLRAASSSTRAPRGVRDTARAPASSHARAQCNAAAPGAGRPCVRPLQLQSEGTPVRCRRERANPDSKPTTGRRLHLQLQ